MTASARCVHGEDLTEVPAPISRRCRGALRPCRTWNSPEDLSHELPFMRNAWLPQSRSVFWRWSTRFAVGSCRCPTPRIRRHRPRLAAWGRHLNRGGQPASWPGRGEQSADAAGLAGQREPDRGLRAVKGDLGLGAAAPGALTESGQQSAGYTGCRRSPRSCAHPADSGTASEAESVSAPVDSVP